MKRITARFDNMDAAELAARRLRGTLGESVLIRDFPATGHTAATDDNDPSGVFVLPFAPGTATGGYAAAYVDTIGHRLDGIAEPLQGREAILSVAAHDKDMDAVSSILTNAGGYFSQIEDMYSGNY